MRDTLPVVSLVLLFCCGWIVLLFAIPLPPPSKLFRQIRIHVVHVVVKRVRLR